MKTIQLQFLMRSNRRALSIKPGDLNLNQDTAVGSIKSGHLSLLLALLHQQMRQLEEINPPITSPCLWFTYSLVVYSFWSFGNKEVTLILGNHCVELTSVLSQWVISVFWLLWTILCEYLYSVNPVFCIWFMYDLLNSPIPWRVMSPTIGWGWKGHTSRTSHKWPQWQMLLRPCAVAWIWCGRPIIPSTQEAETRQSQVPDQPGQLKETVSKEKYKKCWDILHIPCPVYKNKSIQEVENKMCRDNI